MLAINSKMLFRLSPIHAYIYTQKGERGRKNMQRYSIRDHKSCTPVCSARYHLEIVFFESPPPAYEKWKVKMQFSEWKARVSYRNVFLFFFRRRGSKKIREMESGMEKTQQRALYRNKITLSNHRSGKTVKGKRKTILCNQRSEKETRYFFHEKTFL